MAPPNRTARVAVLGSSVQRSRSKKQSAGRARNAVVRRAVLALLVLAALALLTISFRTPTSGALHDVQGAGASALRPFQIAAERVARPFRDVYGYFNGLAGARSENVKLKRELRTLRAQQTADSAGALRAAELERLLHFEGGPSYPKDFRAVNTSVISFPNGPFEQKVSIEAGSSSGIRLNTPLVNADGLLGRVTNVSRSTSSATLITDPDSAVAAVDVKTGVTGIIRHGQGSTLMLDRVSKEKKLHKGDVIVTQGTRDGRYPDLYPYGIPIGVVINVGTSDIASFLTVQVQPYAQFDSLDAVAALIATKHARNVP
ncbi:MAG: rod shape-determining protein MreC [Gaiellaceae bacterium]|nr:rod shape-determining protein MreC [Gaiellaceae bacterium]